MNKTVLIIGGIIIALVVLFFAFNSYIYNEKQGDPTETSEVSNEEITITPISHATFMLEWNGKVIYNDPTGGPEAFLGKPQPNIITISDIHGDHLNLETLQAVSTDSTTLVVPQAVTDMLPETLLGTIVVVKNGEVTNQEGFTIEAIPMYNLPESPDSRHVKGRGNGYVIEASGKRVYIAGDTADIPEMRNLENIDIAFIPMNPPNTMTVESAADAVLSFQPKQVYPYHYRSQDGLSDVSKFKEIVNKDNLDIEVVLLNWYSES